MTHNYIAMRILLLVLCCSICFLSCKQEKNANADSPSKTITGIQETPKYAKGFTITDYGNYKKISVNAPWPGSTNQFDYLLVEKGIEIPSHDENTVVVRTPIERVIVVSTTNIPSLEYLGVEDKLVGFPTTKFISSKKTRALVENGSVRELGNDLEINLELVLELNPDLVIGFSVNGNNKTLNSIEKLGIPVILDGAWVEEHPLGRAEWIKFIAAFFNKDEEANTIFKTIETDYLEAKKLAKTVAHIPVVFSGDMFKDVWNVPGGNSFIAKYLEDANTNYLWKDNENTGSIQLSFESVLDKAQNAEMWIGAGNFNTKAEMEKEYEGYALFDAYKTDNIYTYTKNKGDNEGLLFYELGPLRPDLILKDIIKVAHPEVLPDYETYFFKRLE